MSKYINRDDGNNTRGGVSFLGLLQLLFIALKLMGYIEWSWWQVLLPIILWACTVGGAIFVVLSVYAYAHGSYAWSRYQRRRR